MIKKLMGVLLALVFLAAASAIPVYGLTVIRGSEPEVTPLPMDPTEAPTQAPTQAPTEAPTQAPTAAPTHAPTQAPTAIPTAVPTAIPTAAPTQAPTQAPAQTPAPSTPMPSVTPWHPTNVPTQEPSYVAYSLWQKAADTIQTVKPGQMFDIYLVEGISEYVSFSELYGNLPASVSFVNELDSIGSCRITGSIVSPGAFPFAIEFVLRTGSKLQLNFNLRVEEDAIVTPAPAPVGGFPAANPLVPFGGSPAACLPMDLRKEDA